MLPADCSRRWDPGGGRRVAGGNWAAGLTRRCVPPRLLAELRGALDACAERQRQLERSLRVCRRLLRAWYAAPAPSRFPSAPGRAPGGATGASLGPGACPRAGPSVASVSSRDPPEPPAAEPHPGPGTNEADSPPAPASTSARPGPSPGAGAGPPGRRAPLQDSAFAGDAPSPQDLRELELLTRALEKAARVRKSVCKAAESAEGPGLRPGSAAAAPATAASARPRASGPSSSRTSETRAPRGTWPASLPARTSEPQPLTAGRPPCIGRTALATRPAQGLRDQQAAPRVVAPEAPGAFLLKEKGTLLQLPVAFRKAAAQNSRLWAQLSSTQPSDPTGAAAARAQFLRKMQAAVSLCGRPSPWGSGLRAAEVEAEVGRLRKACSLLRLHMREELAAGPSDRLQEYRGLLTLEGLQALAGQCLHRLQELRAVVTEQQLEPWPEGRLSRTASPCGGGTDATGRPPLLRYSSTKELQALAALRLRVAVLDQQIHLEKVLMAELLPLAGAGALPGPPLALRRALHSLLCEGGEQFLSVLRDPPAD
ncbi:LOW QUALITY PROTEIN: Tubulin epsilon and delta complex protein 2 [Galemys pyrenaicus]|uniref:Tubulin epsilon and delta complex protein 2 n=1 Tax=Galemys pyrenaicus TaxID=202257 RepID=A0A8J5ZSY9_GALPY|nr:LOW QUALITY PROTEIN: Tubulin epsilon and delta complex protein 2 [Galemys pyrenaicus]